VPINRRIYLPSGRFHRWNSDGARTRLRKRLENRFSTASVAAGLRPEPINDLQKCEVRYRIVARHYRELANREEQSDKARVAEHLELLKLKRREAVE
jgi:hypothetical protein